MPDVGKEHTMEQQFASYQQAKSAYLLHRNEQTTETMEAERQSLISGMLVEMPEIIPSTWSPEVTVGAAIDARRLN